MSVALTLGRVNFWVGGEVLVQPTPTCTCAEARAGCTPSYVFSIVGQVRFRTALKHLSTCRRLPCRRLKARLVPSARQRLLWLMQEQALLGCVLVQPYLYGARRVLLTAANFPLMARHLANCPKETCARLRRSLLLRIRNDAATPF